MKFKSIILALILTFGIVSTVFANDETAKVHFEKLTSAYEVTGDAVRVRTHPTTEGYIICELNKGTLVKSFDYEEEPYKDDSGMKWRYVFMKDGHVGWICADYLKFKK